MKQKLTDLNQQQEMALYKLPGKCSQDRQIPIMDVQHVKVKANS